MKIQDKKIRECKQLFEELEHINLPNNFKTKDGVPIPASYIKTYINEYKIEIEKSNYTNKEYITALYYLRDKALL